MPSKRRLYLVELFSGSKSVSRAVQRRFGGTFEMRVCSVDIDASSKPSVTADIASWDYKRRLAEFLRNRRESDLLFVWQSPPCTPFSRANTTGMRDLEGGKRNVLAGLEITRWLRPDSFFLENPVGLLMEMPWMQRYQRLLNVCSYCRYGKPYRKNTCIWSDVNLDLKTCSGKTLCANKAALGYHPVTAQSGSTARSLGSGGGRNVYPIPSKLVAHLFARAIEHADAAR